MINHTTSLGAANKILRSGRRSQAIALQTIVKRHASGVHDKQDLKRAEPRIFGHCWVRLAARFFAKYGIGSVKSVTATRSIEVFALASLCAPLYATLRQLISLVDSIRVVLFLIVPVSQNGGAIVHHQN